MKNNNSISVSQYRVAEPLTSPGSSILRWLFAGVIAGQTMLLFLFVIQKTDPVYILQQVPPMIMDYIVLAPEQPQPPKPQPKAKKPPETVTIEKPVPVAEAPVEPSIDNSFPADIVATPVPRKKVTVAPPVRIMTADVLDNTEFAPIVNPKPLYPEIALKNNIEGYVDVDLFINEKGYIDSFTFADIRGHDLFGEETARVMPRWRFPPPRIKGKKVKVKYVYRIKFTLD